MTLATYQDANKWLDQNKVKFLNDEDATDDATDADTYVRSRLATVFPDFVNNWDASGTQGGTPEATPAVVRNATALLMASYRYAKIYSEEALGENDYSARLEARALDILTDLVNGDMMLYDIPLEISSEVITKDDYWPNEDTIITPDNQELFYNSGDPDRRFTMDKRW